MVVVNDVITNPVAGEAVRFVTISPGMLRFELTLEPRAGGPPAHQHPAASETFTVRSGRVRVRDGRDRMTLAAGQSMTIAAGVIHGFWNEDDQPAVIEVEVVPGTRLAEFLEAVYATRDGRVRPNGKPALLPMAALLDEYRDSIALPTPPLAVQRVLCAALGAVARWRGHAPRPGAPR